MLPYQNQTVMKFAGMLSAGTRDILEIGSDMGAEVACALAEMTGARVVGINPSEAFPAPQGAVPATVTLLRADGRELPFPDASFDAVFCVATMEHVDGLDRFLAEVDRVLRPGGLFHTEFSPVWSSARGHHVFAVVGSKEARFWKPGKNPVPDHAHLLWTPDEMREYLRSGPTAEELIEPIVQWIYYGKDINRCHFEDYLEAFANCPLVMQDIRLEYDTLSAANLAQLAAKYGASREFRCHSVSAELRKLPEEGLRRTLFRRYLVARIKVVPPARQVRSLLHRVRHALISISRSGWRKV